MSSASLCLAALAFVPILAAIVLRWRPGDRLILVGALAFEAGLLLRGLTDLLVVPTSWAALAPGAVLVLLVATVVVACSNAHRTSVPGDLVALGLVAAALIVHTRPVLAVLVLIAGGLALVLARVESWPSGGRSVTGQVRDARTCDMAVLLVVAAVPLGAGAALVAVGGPTARLAQWLLVVGLAAVTGAVPFQAWIGRRGAAGEQPPLGLALAVIGGPATVLVAEYARVAQLAPGGQPIGAPLLGIGLLAGLVGALLAFGAPSARRLPAEGSPSAGAEGSPSATYLVASAGAVAIAGLADGSDVGLVGMVVIALATALAVALVDLGQAEGDSRLGRLALGAGLFGLAGAPALVGFVGRWAIDVVAAAAGDGYLILALTTSAVGLLAAGRGALGHVPAVDAGTLAGPTVGSLPERTAGGSIGRGWPRLLAAGALWLLIVGLGCYPALVLEALQAGLAGVGPVLR